MRKAKKARKVRLEKKEPKEPREKKEQPEQLVLKVKLAYREHLDSQGSQVR